MSITVLHILNKNKT